MTAEKLILRNQCTIIKALQKAPWLSRHYLEYLESSIKETGEFLDKKSKFLDKKSK